MHPGLEFVENNLSGDVVYFPLCVPTSLHCRFEPGFREPQFILRPFSVVDIHH